MQSVSLPSGSGLGIGHGQIKYKIANRVVMSWQKANHLPMISMKSATAHTSRARGRIPLQVRAMENSSESLESLRARAEKVFINAIKEASARSCEPPKVSIHDLIGPRDPNCTVRSKKAKLPGDPDSENDEEWTEIENKPVPSDHKCNICGKIGDHMFCPYLHYYPAGAHLEPDTPLVLIDNTGQIYSRNSCMYDERRGPRRVMQVLEEPKFDDGKYSSYGTGY